MMHNIQLPLLLLAILLPAHSRELLRNRDDAYDNGKFVPSFAVEGSSLSQDGADEDDLDYDTNPFWLRRIQEVSSSLTVSDDSEPSNDGIDIGGDPNESKDEDRDGHNADGSNDAASLEIIDVGCRSEIDPFQSDWTIELVGYTTDMSEAEMSELETVFIEAHNIVAQGMSCKALEREVQSATLALDFNDPSNDSSRFMRQRKLRAQTESRDLIDVPSAARTLIESEAQTSVYEGSIVVDGTCNGCPEAWTGETRPEVATAVRGGLRHQEKEPRDPESARREARAGRPMPFAKASRGQDAADSTICSCTVDEVAELPDAGKILREMKRLVKQSTDLPNIVDVVDLRRK